MSISDTSHNFVLCTFISFCTCMCCQIVDDALNHEQNQIGYQYRPVSAINDQLLEYWLKSQLYSHWLLTSYCPSSLAIQPGPPSELNVAVTGTFMGNVSQEVISGCIFQCFSSIYHFFSNCMGAQMNRELNLYSDR